MPRIEPFVLLASAYDYGGAEGIAEVYRAAQLDSRIHMELVAAGPALQLFRSRGLVVRSAPEERVTAFDSEHGLARYVRNLLLEVRPSAILTALSGEKAGIDEVLQHLAGNTPGFVLQDFWGDVNLTLGGSASTYLVIDDVAAEISLAKGVNAAAVVGSAKHAAYENIDASAARHMYRAARRIGETTRLLLFCGQPLWEQKGYCKSIASLLRAARKVAPDARYFYRPHPAELRSGVDFSSLADAGWEIDMQGRTADALSAADVCVSIFSSTGYDQIVLSRFSPAPLGSVVYLLCDDDLRRWVADKTGVETFPVISLGVALQAEAENLEIVLSQAFDTAVRDAMWRRARDIVPDPAGAPSQVLNAIVEAVAA